MKYTKYLASTLALMSAAALVSCDADKVVVQQTSPDDLAAALAAAGIGDAEALAAALNGVGNLPAVAPNKILLPMSRISMIVENITTTNQSSVCQLGEGGPEVAYGQELTVDFESGEFADLYVDSALIANNGEVINYLADPNGPNFSFSFREADGSNGGTGVELLRDVNYTVVTSMQKTLIGTFSTGSPVCSPPSLNTFNYHDIATPAGASAAFISGANGDNIEVTNSSATELFTLPANVVIVRVGSTTEGKVYVKQGGDASDFDQAAADALSKIEYTEGSGSSAPTIGANFQELCVFYMDDNQECNFSGTFRLDMNPSLGAIDGIVVDGLNDGYAGEQGSLEIPLLP